LTTTAILENNTHRDLDEMDIGRLLHDYFGARQTVYLERLDGEPTGHVDMFAAFVSRDTVVVGTYDPNVDPLNAALLDRNATRLGEIRTATGPLRVVRIPMPGNHDGVWRTYTNVTFANGVLLVPVYADADPAVQADALALYQQLLPRWTVVPIEAAGLIPCGGALHCVSKSLLSLGPRPRPTHRLAVVEPAQRMTEHRFGPGIHPAPMGLP
jgi:agmatine/peptidylarginine deiminase